MNDLISRLERATGPDAELDRAIQAWSVGAIGERQGDNQYWAYYRDGSWVSIGEIQPYTASLDAAVAFCERVLPGWDGLLPLRASGEAWVWPSGGMGKGFRVNGATPAIALLIATLRALDRAKQGGSPDA